MSDHHVTLSESGYPRECSCAEYQRRKKAYRIPLPCSHMLAVLASLPREPERDPYRARVDAEPYYADTYDVTIGDARFIGAVSGNGAVRILGVEVAGKRADYPLDQLTTEAVGEAAASLAAKARALAACGEVDTMALPNVRTWREDERQSLVHAKSRGDRRAQYMLDTLAREESERSVAVAAWFAGKAVAA